MSTKPSSQFPVFVALKMPFELAQDVKRAAREDGRTVSGYLRRLIAAGVPPSAAGQRADRQNESR